MHIPNQCIKENVRQVLFWCIGKLLGMHLKDFSFPFAIVSSLIFSDEKRQLGQVFPEPVRKLWNDWELRAMVLISLALQISLIYNGNRRKYTTTIWLRVVTWSSYLMADWVATVALGVLSNQEGDSNSCNADKRNSHDVNLTAFWAPFLLLHLGGPDTITAYALADNELWMRHMLGLVVQICVAIYITLVAWQGNQLSYFTIPMLLCGTIKYGERSLALRCANWERFRDSIFARQDPGPNYAKFMEEFSLKEEEGYHVTADEVVEVHVTGDDADQNESKNSVYPNANIMLKAKYFFEKLRFKRLFVDLIISFLPRDESQSYFQKLDPQTAYEVIEVELGFAYDAFYTKAPIVYTRLGFVFRFITASLTLSVCLAFTIFIGLRSWKHQIVDLIITYILLIGAIFLEAYASISLLSSDWANLWLSKHSRTHWLVRAILCLRFHMKEKRWSNSMAQYNLLNFCLKQKRDPYRGLLRFLPLGGELEKLQGKLGRKLENMHQLKSRPEVSPELKAYIFEHFLNKSKYNDTEIVILCTSRGTLTLQTHGIEDECIIWTTEVEFDRSILIWHIATDLCYQVDFNRSNKNNMLFSKQLADYMLYLLIMCPFMLPAGIGMIRFRDTCAEAQEFFQDRSPIADKLAACQMLRQVNTKVPPVKVKGDRSKSVLFDACRLAASLQAMGFEEKWEVVTDVWVEMLGYAASKCRGYYHAQQLRKGGELLTHVWLLMAHLGITEQYQISEGHARVKLAVK